MTEDEFQIIRAVGFALALGIATLSQRLSPHGRLAGSWRINGTFWVLDVLVVGLVCGACACTAARWAEARQIGVFHSIVVPSWFVLLATIIALDLVSYAWHRANHAIPFLWRFHRVHHSDRSFTVSTALRFHPGELLLSLPLRLAVVVALGASPAAVVAFEILFAIANLVEHGDINLPPSIERVVGAVCVTPALHRLHHSREWAELQTNFGTVFVVWDRLLGSYRANSSAATVETGLPGAATEPRFGEAILMPLRSVVLGRDSQRA